MKKVYHANLSQEKNKADLCLDQVAFGESVFWNIVSVLYFVSVQKYQYDV